MTTLVFKELTVILEQIKYIQLRRRLLRIGTHVAACAAVVMASLLVALPACGLWTGQPPAFLRWGLLIALLGLWATCAVVLVLRSLLWRPNTAQTARFIEQNLPELRNDLINSVLLGSDSQQASPQLVQMAIREAAMRSARADLTRSVSLTAFNRWCIAAAVASLALGSLFMFAPRMMGRGMAAVFSPGSYIAQVGTVNILGVTPGDATAYVGERLKIAATVQNPSGDPLPAEVLVKEPDSSGRTPVGDPQPMIAQPGNETFNLVLGPLSGTLHYAVRIGDSRWPADKEYYTVTVLRQIKVKSIEATYQYPQYLAAMKDSRGGRPFADKTVKTDGTLEAPAGTRATLRLTLDEPAPSANLLLNQGAVLAMAGSDGRTFEQPLTIDKDGSYCIQLLDRGGAVLGRLPGGSAPAAAATGAAAQWRIHAIKDNPPSVDFIAPMGNFSAAPGSTVPVSIKVSDDYAVGNVQLLLGPEGQERPLGDFDAKPAIGARTARLDYALKLPALPEGAVLVLCAAARDNNPGGQTSTSYKLKITLQDTARLAREKADRYNQLRDRLMAILRMQETQRLGAELAAKSGDLKAATAKGGEVHAGQTAIRREMLDVLAKTTFDPEMTTIQQALAVLAQNEAPLAVEQAKVLAALSQLSELANAAHQLAGTQNRIINALQMMLAIMPSLSREGVAAATRPSGDLSSEAREKLKQLKNDLEKFIDAQKKIIQASENLAKKNVDNFTAEDEKLLKDLRAQQDQWEKFLNEAFTDFSKLAQQDFSNPVMLKELQSIKSDVTMAKDALSQKAAEIATALEDNGIENAKTLTANIEKWLPDVPDRQKWTMEDQTSKDLIEQADLPKELEDLVGDLLEQEEDLFDQVQDQTSSYAQSGDKGIGWDAMDGPISNMNAQGVTGNQLPNSNELSGRSGEGRQGKASGEFVEDKAVGKGGRRTPTRLTNEPFQKGQIDDKSPEAAGGSTGGGKVSGSGGEGLEGPVPPPLSKELERMTKQASLVNRAERIQAQFKQGDYANFKFLQAITLMNQVKTDMAANRYQNALRARHVTIESLQQTRLALSGRLDVQADTSAAMPKYVRDDVADAMQDKLPPQFEEALREYYKKLNEAK